MAKLKITYARSSIGASKDQKATIASLGLRKLNSFAVHQDTSTTRGMIFKVKHLVRVEEVADSEQTTAEKRKAQLSAPAKAAPAAAPVVAATEPTVSAVEPVTEAAPVVAPTSGQGDDLEIIEGIGPKIAGVLAEAGVTTFQQLAGMSAEEISALLAGKVRIAHTETWAEQAQLAADGKLDELKALQDQLNAGRRD